MNMNNIISRVAEESLDKKRNLVEKDSIRIDRRSSSRVFKEVDDFHPDSISTDSPCWNYYYPPIQTRCSYVVHRQEIGMLNDYESFVKPSVSQQFSYLSFNKWPEWSKFSIFDTSKSEEISRMNAFDKAFTPTTVFHQIDKNVEELYLRYLDIPYLSIEKITDLDRKCESIRESLVRTKKRALEDLEKILDRQIKNFDESIGDVVKSHKKVAEMVDDHSVKEKMAKENIIVSQKPTPLTKLILRCDDVLRIVFSFLLTKDILRQFCPSASYFYNYVKSKVPLTIQLYPVRLDRIPIDVTLKGFKIKKFSVEVDLKPSGVVLIRNFSRLLNFLQQHKDELEEVRFYQLEYCQFGILEYQRNYAKANKEKYQEFVLSMKKKCVEKARKICDQLNEMSNLKILFTQILPSDMKCMKNLTEIYYPVKYSFLDGSIREEDMKDSKTFNGNFRVVKDLEVIRKSLENKNFPKLQKLVLLDPIFVDHFTKLKHGILEAHIPLFTDLYDSIITNCGENGLKTFVTRIMFGFETFSSEFIEFVSTKIKRVGFYYFGDNPNKRGRNDWEWPDNPSSKQPPIQWIWDMRNKLSVMQGGWCTKEQRELLEKEVSSSSFPKEEESSLGENNEDDEEDEGEGEDEKNEEKKVEEKKEEETEINKENDGEKETHQNTGGGNEPQPPQVLSTEWNEVGWGTERYETWGDTKRKNEKVVMEKAMLKTHYFAKFLEKRRPSHLGWEIVLFDIKGDQGRGVFSKRGEYISNDFVNECLLMLPNICYYMDIGLDNSSVYPTHDPIDQEEEGEEKRKVQQVFSTYLVDLLRKMRFGCNVLHIATVFHDGEFADLYHGKEFLLNRWVDKHHSKEEMTRLRTEERMRQSALTTFHQVMNEVLNRQVLEGIVFSIAYEDRGSVSKLKEKYRKELQEGKKSDGKEHQEEKKSDGKEFELMLIQKYLEREICHFPQCLFQSILGDSNTTVTRVVLDTSFKFGCMVTLGDLKKLFYNHVLPFIKAFNEKEILPRKKMDGGGGSQNKVKVFKMSVLVEELLCDELIEEGESVLKLTKIPDDVLEKKIEEFLDDVTKLLRGVVLEVENTFFSFGFRADIRYRIDKCLKRQFINIEIGGK